jgi:hypothetical protein
LARGGDRLGAAKGWLAESLAAMDLIALGAEDMADPAIAAAARTRAAEDIGRAVLRCDGDAGALSALIDHERWWLMLEAGLPVSFCAASELSAEDRARFAAGLAANPFLAHRAALLDSLETMVLPGMGSRRAKPARRPPLLHLRPQGGFEDISGGFALPHEARLAAFRAANGNEKAALGFALRADSDSWARIKALRQPRLEAEIVRSATGEAPRPRR